MGKAKPAGKMVFTNSTPHPPSEPPTRVGPKAPNMHIQVHHACLRVHHRNRGLYSVDTCRHCLPQVGTVC